MGYLDNCVFRYIPSKGKNPIFKVRVSNCRRSNVKTVAIILKDRQRIFRDECRIFCADVGVWGTQAGLQECLSYSEEKCEASVLMVLYEFYKYFVRIGELFKKLGVNFAPSDPRKMECGPC